MSAPVFRGSLAELVVFLEAHGGLALDLEAVGRTCLRFAGPYELRPVGWHAQLFERPGRTWTGRSRASSTSGTRMCSACRKRRWPRGVARGGESWGRARRGSGPGASVSAP